MHRRHTAVEEGRRSNPHPPPPTHQRPCIPSRLEKSAYVRRSHTNCVSPLVRPAPPWFLINMGRRNIRVTLTGNNFGVGHRSPQLLQASESGPKNTIQLRGHDIHTLLRMPGTSVPGVRLRLICLVEDSRSSAAAQQWASDGSPPAFLHTRLLIESTFYS